MRVIVVGLGGIGTHLVEPLARTLAFSKSESVPKRIVLVDGDAYEARNRERQKYGVIANKAEATKDWLQPLFTELQIDSRPHFIDEKNVFFIKDNDVIFLAVDNHATRKLVSSHIAKLKDAVLVSGGNELYDGNIQIYVRQGGEDKTPPLTHLHPEIEFPKDRNPAEKSCGELVEESEPQLLAVNLAIASMMLNAYTLWLNDGKIPYSEVYFDLQSGNCRAVKIGS